MSRFTTSASLYESDGVTLIHTLPTARKITFQRVRNAAGNGSFEVPFADATSVVDGKIVKLYLRQDSTVIASFAVRVQGDVEDFAVDSLNRRWVSFQNQPGVLSLLADASIYPEYGGDGTVYTAEGIDERPISPDRYAGYMSASRGPVIGVTHAEGGPWYIPANWPVPPTPRTFGTGTRGALPAGFAGFDSTAQWISYYDPDVSQSGKAVSYGYAEFSVTDPVDVRIMYSFDDYGDLWVDGQQLVQADRTQHNNWRVAQTVDYRLPAGAHIIAYFNSNAPNVPGHDNPVAAILSMRALDPTTDKPTGSPIINTNGTDWSVNDGDPEPAYRKGQLLLRFLAEATVRTVDGCAALNPTWDDVNDSDGHAWTDLGGAFSFPIGTVSLLDVFTQLCEQGIDMHVDPATMNLGLHKRFGSDLSGSVALTMGDVGGNLAAYTLTSLPVQFTSLIAQLSTGVFATKQDATAVAAHGLIEAGVSLGSVGTVASAAVAMQKLLDEAAHPLATMTARVVLNGAGPIPFVDFNEGDSITVPARRNSGTMKARVMDMTVDGQDDVPTVTFNLIEDLS